MHLWLKIKDSCLFKKLPVEYHWNETSSTRGAINDQPSLHGLPSDATPGETKASKCCILHNMKQCPSRWARYTLAHSIGRWLLYPGSVSFLTKVPLTLLVKCRTHLMENYNGRRAKLITCDGNEIDTMFVDRRKEGSWREQESQLVICCEGNGSFYEMGCFYTPLKAGYSVLGWNRPGFARSTGKPSPQKDINAMDVVIQYAIHHLKFGLPAIAVYGYSLGSYTASWAAMTYPELGALVLDASFDSLLPLAVKMTGKSCRKLVVQMVKEHFDLNVAELMCQYPGPVLLIRRTLDEITSTQNNLPAIRTNRANELLLQLLKCRYPDIICGEEDAVRLWLMADCPQVETLIYRYYYKVDEHWCIRQLQSYRSSLEPNCNFPWRVGRNLSPIRRKQLAVFLASKHLKNVETTHGRTLPSQEFEMPWML
ncbi:protein ABHD16B-like [Hemicordylus capensis]|uniref:protein ABHD16B-like n=1 Tax=Hemicordylus capensis TaxID=884348 RepID=UPI002304BE6B|nr:protein ABHD16B-like [Hemicordylus capensis]XP_053103828.1 protein ABHD16B-like [Hemicordylus capensis]